MLSHVAELIVRVTELAEAEGRDLRKVVGRLMAGLAFALVASGLGLVGAALLLAGLWLALADSINRAAASAITGAVAVALAYAALKLCERCSR